MANPTDPDALYESALYIDTAEALADLCTQLRTRPYVAIDTEFLRERTYRPELCLVQVKHDELLACIDTIAIDDLSALTGLLLDQSVTKVFHAASQDLEIFYLLAKEVPTPLFDTQIAAPLLGYNEQIGYGNLVNEHLGVELAKTHTRADWTRRPLPAQQIRYALDDVIYLEALYIDMHKQLKQMGRLSWLQPEFDEAAREEKYEQPAAERWKKIRNIQRYKGPALSIIQQLAKWREIKARETNQPRNWLLKDDVLLNIAQQQPDSAEELSHIRSLERKTRDRFGSEILQIVATAKDQTPEPLPPFAKKQKLNGGNLARLQLLNAWVHQRGEELDIAPALLAPQKILEKMVTGDGRAALSGWRDPLLGDDLTALLEGRAVLTGTKTGLKLTPA
ncbi:ribonuclease D [Granulosicoccus antarcticus]|uniref:Ribonuclease D n=1 Tax=Granulosicoccus antarcticus IMCC3135 TaxID=1192854 RepID=A0A2Z2NX01_9GAMM|nr:ribonuclease D [Granulosicoccus antarcticus]ASJ74521.1 Ribonuclease D [Granulosicoccus antarcticus IMCC3135]